MCAPPVALQGRELPCPAADGGDGDPARFRPDVLGPGRGLRAPGQHQTATHGDDAVPQLFQQGLHVVTRRHLHAEIFFGQGRTGQVGPATGQEHLLLLPGLAPLFPALLPPAGQGMGLPGGMFRLFRLLAPARFGPAGACAAGSPETRRPERRDGPCLSALCSGLALPPLRRRGAERFFSSLSASCGACSSWRAPRRGAGNDRLCVLM